MAPRGGGIDVAVVGTGPGGGMVARDLTRQGARVAMLEWGGNAPVDGSITRCMGSALIPGRGLLVTNGLLTLVRGITTGGSSIHYYATAFDPPLEMFRRYGIELSGELAAVKAELPCAPLADELIGPAATRVMASARDLGYDWRPLPKLVYQEKCRAGCDLCTVGCPHGAKWTARMAVDEAVAHGARLITRARATKVLVEDGAAVGVEYRHEGSARTLHADRVVIAAGGLGTPAILRASGIPGAGRDFFFDPLLLVIGAADEHHDGREFPMAAGVCLEEDGCVLTDLLWPRWLDMLFTAETLRFDRLLDHSRSLAIMVKVRDDLGGHLTKRGGVRKRLSEGDRARLNEGAARAREILAHAGARHVYTTLCTATHPGGTAKIGDVVDSDLASELDNLYVCDASVIPEAWGRPPTLTIVALAKRLAKHLAVH